MSYVLSTPSPESTETAGQPGQGSPAIRGKSQQQRYASFSCAYRIVNNPGSRATAHILRGSTSLTTIPFLTYFIFIGRPSLTETRAMTSVPLEGANGTANDGGTNSHKFAKDGELSCSGRHHTWVFASSVHGTRQLQICSPTHLPFHSSSITMTNIATSLQK